MKKISIILIICVLTGCITHPKPSPCPVVDSQEEEREFLQWYETYLRKTEEGIIRPPYDEGEEMYRFLWVRTFHQPIVIRIVRSHDQMTLIGKRLSGAGGYQAGPIDLRVNKPMSREEWTHFQDLLTAAKFWELPFQEPQKVTDDGEGCIILLDGALWSLEGIYLGQSHIVKRRFIMDYPAFQQACLYLLSLSEIPVLPEYIY